MHIFYMKLIVLLKVTRLVLVIEINQRYIILDLLRSINVYTTLQHSINYNVRQVFMPTISSYSII